MEQQPTEEPNIPVPRDVLYLLLIQSLHYAMGRKSYAVSVTADAIRRFWSQLTAPMKSVFLRDLREEIDRAERGEKTFGMQMDHDTWVGLLKDLEESG